MPSPFVCNTVIVNGHERKLRQAHRKRKNKKQNKSKTKKKQSFSNNIDYSYLAIRTRSPEICSYAELDLNFLILKVEAVPLFTLPLNSVEAFRYYTTKASSDSLKNDAVLEVVIICLLPSKTSRF